MSDGQLPKAYLRIDPNIDQTRPDLAAYVRLMCAANRQPRRGRFKSLDLIAAIVGRAAAKRYITSGDLVLDADGRYVLDGWDSWQEGDLTVGDRMRRLRRKRHGTVTGGVTASSPDRIADRNAPSEASGVRRQASDDSPASAGSSPRAIFEDPEGEALTWLARHGCYIIEGNGYHRKLITATERHGVNAIVGMLDRLKEAGMQDGDTKGFLFGAIDALDARSRPNLEAVEREE